VITKLTRYLGNTNTLEVHDPLIERTSCQLDEIKPEHRRWYDTLTEAKAGRARTREVAAGGVDPVDGGPMATPSIDGAAARAGSGPLGSAEEDLCRDAEKGAGAQNAQH